MSLGRKLLLAGGLLFAAIGGFFVWRLSSADIGARRQFRYLPADAVIAVHLDLAGLRQNPLIRQFAAETAPRLDPDYEKFVRQTGFQFERDLDTISLGISTNPDGKGEAVVNAFLDGRFDQMRAALDGDSRRADRRTLSGYAVDSYDGPGGRRFRISFLSGRRMAFSNSAGAAPMDQMISLWAGESEGFEKRLEEIGVFRHLPAGSQLWLAVDMERAGGIVSVPTGAIAPGTSFSADLLRGSRMVLVAAHAGERDVVLRLVARCSGASEARRVADSLSGIRALLAAMASRRAPSGAPSEVARTLERIKIDVEADTALVRLNIENTMLEKWMRSAALPAGAAEKDRKVQDYRLIGQPH